MAPSKASRPHLLDCVALAGAMSLASPAQADYASFTFSPEAPYYVEDAKVDFGTYNGFRRYHSECHVCHGPAGLGSSYAPALMKSLQDLTYNQFIGGLKKSKIELSRDILARLAVEEPKAFDALISIVKTG